MTACTPHPDLLEQNKNIAMAALWVTCLSNHRGLALNLALAQGGY
jgi:hypothetical protein